MQKKKKKIQSVSTSVQIRLACQSQDAFSLLKSHFSRRTLTYDILSQHLNQLGFGIENIFKKTKQTFIFRAVSALPSSNKYKQSIYEAITLRTSLRANLTRDVFSSAWSISECYCAAPCEVNLLASVSLPSCLTSGGIFNES